MFDQPVPPDTVPAAVATRDGVRGWAAQLGAEALAPGRLGELGDGERVDLLGALEDLKSAAAALQARVAVDLDASQRATQAAAGVPAKEQGRGVAAQVALARRDSPAQGSRHLGLARALVAEMPHTFAALAAGRLSEWRATILVRESATLSREHRHELDRVLARSRPGGHDPLAGLGDRALAAEARQLGYRLDPGSVLRRHRGAVSDRRVSVRPAPDTMTYLTGFLPVAQGVAVHAALSRHADTLRASGDERSRGQIMADTLVERVTGQPRLTATPVEIHLVMTDRALLAGADDPALLLGECGARPVPASLARDLVLEAGRAWVRRLHLDAGGHLVGMDSHRRTFTGLLRRFLVIRDQSCRTPWCDAPVRHLDHVVPHEDGGPTSAANAQGLCQACNHAKQAPGWTSRPRPGPAEPVVELRTPTGHRHRSRAPAPPGPPEPPMTQVERIFSDVLVA